MRIGTAMTTAAHFAMNPSLRFQTGLGALATAALAALACPAAQAEAPPPEAWYAGVHLGAGHVSGWPARVDFGGVSVEGRLALDNGRRAGLLLGRHAGAWRIEAQAQRGTLRCRRRGWARWGRTWTPKAATAR